MAFNPLKFDINEWLILENTNILAKVCNVYYAEGLLTERYRTRLHIVPVGEQNFEGNVINSAPSLFRAFSYDEAGNQLASIPEMREWSQACEDAAIGILPGFDPSTGIPIGLKVAKITNTYGEQTGVASGAEVTLASLTVPVDRKVFVRSALGQGDNRGLYTVYIDAVPEGQKRGWWTNAFNMDMDFSSANGGIEVDAGILIELKVRNDGPAGADFSGAIQTVLV